MAKMLVSCTQVTTLHKITTHTNIDGSEQANALAKHGCELDHKMLQHHMNTRTLHHIASRKIGGTPCKGHPTKAPWKIHPPA